MRELEKSIKEIDKIAESFGLTPFEMIYELCPAEVIYNIGAYGMPNRFNHWSFGKSFHRMKTMYDTGLSKIYELVINSNPCYAFLLDTNSLIQNKLIVAHVIGHSDFFRNNRAFSKTNRKMLREMEDNAKNMYDYEQAYGKQDVEDILDAAMSVQEHQQVLNFIEKNSPILDDWQRNIVSIINNEMAYFKPQMETKIMNEGWATFWHTRILRDLPLSESEIIDYSRFHSGVIAPNPKSLNPYLIGFKMFEFIEKECGRDFLFDIREVDTDVSFIRNYYTKELARDLDLYIYGKKRKSQTSGLIVQETEYEKVRDSLINSLINNGLPMLTAREEDGRLMIFHQYENKELDVNDLNHVLPHLYKLWGNDVLVETIYQEKKIIYRYDGEEIEKIFS